MGQMVKTSLATGKRMHILSSRGDDTVTWDTKDPIAMRRAQALFEEFRKQGHLAFRTRADGSNPEPIHKFDPDAEVITMSPALVGG